MLRRPALVFALIMAAGGFAAADPAASPAPSPSAGESAAPKVMHTASVDTKNFAFDPPALTVAPGTRVTFTNSDPAAHTVTATDKTDGKPVFDSGDMQPKATWAYVFSKAGTYKYYCAYHTYMTGTIVVK